MRKKLMVIVALVMATISLLVATGASADAVYESGSQNLDIVLRVGYKVYNGAVYNEITAPHVSGHSTIVDVSHAKNYAITFQNSLGKTSYSSLVGSAFATIGANCASRAGLSLSATKTPTINTYTISASSATGMYRYEMLCPFYKCTFTCYRNSSLVRTVTVLMPKQSGIYWRMYRYANLPSV